MEKHVTVGVILALTMILSTFPATASLWEHSEESQGRDGTLWANIPGAPSTNQAQMPLPFAECAIGSHQSPIAINLTSNLIPITINPKTQNPDNNPAAEPERHANSLHIRYMRSTSSIEGANIGKNEDNAYVFRNTGHAVQVSFSKGYPGKLFIGRELYPLVQLHFHAPSEHVVITDKHPSGKQYGGELHFVHQRDDGRLAVLGVFLDDSKHYGENPILKKILENTPRKHDTYNQAGAGIALDPSKLIPGESGQVFTYAGSLTTPPCSEGVSWYVLSEPLKVTPAQIRQLDEFFPLNSRIVQNTAARTVEIHKDLQVDHDHDHHY
ncbi:MAG TPA: carbonic anhydrase family protein [Nitrospira sp.]|nr:carbonic anhydrase family protein [Nitrospira sp.]